MVNINLICIRHGQSEANVNKNIYLTVPDHRIPLTELGMKQASTVGDHLSRLYTKANVVIHSPWSRAKHTAQLISDKIKPERIIEDPLIHEISLVNSYNCMENWQTNFCSDNKTKYSTYWYKEGTSESYADTYQRARIFIQDLKLNRYDFKNGDNVFVVSHGIFLLMIIAVLNKLTVNQVLKERWLDNCEYFTNTLKVIEY